MRNNLSLKVGKLKKEKKREAEGEQSGELHLFFH